MPLTSSVLNNTSVLSVMEHDTSCCEVRHMQTHKHIYTQAHATHTHRTHMHSHMHTRTYTCVHTHTQDRLGRAVAVVFSPGWLGGWRPQEGQDVAAEAHGQGSMFWGTSSPKEGNPNAQTCIYTLV